MKKSNDILKEKLQEHLESPEINKNVMHVIHSYANQKVKNTEKKISIKSIIKYALIITAAVLLTLQMNTENTQFNSIDEADYMSNEFAMLDELNIDFETNLNADDEFEEMLEISSAIDLLLNDDEE